MGTNIRVVAIEGTSSGRRIICQLDTGFAEPTRDTFAIDSPPWAMSSLKVGDAMTVTDKPSLVENAGGGAATSGATVYTFAPGGVADPTNRVYTSWATLRTAHDADTGQRTIQLDNTAGAITIPSGTQPFANRTSLIPKTGTTTPMAVTLASGAVLQQPAFLSPLLNFTVA